MHRLALIGIFMTAFAITANMQIYIQSLRIGIYSWHIFLPVIPAQIALALALGNFFKLDKPTRLYFLWWTLFILIVGASILLVDGGPKAVSEATRYATIAAISLTFLAVIQQPSLAKSAALGVTCATLFAAGISFVEFINPDFNMVVDQRYETRVQDGVVARVGGLHQNPNTNARLMVLGLFASVFFMPQKYRLIYCLVVGAAVFTTVSRSGIVTWALAMIMLTALGQFAPGKLMIKLLGFGVVIAMAVALSLGLIPDILETVGLDEYMSERMLDRLSTGFFSQGDSSTEGRKDLFNLGMELYSSNAFIGAGLGASAFLGDTGLGPHNTMLEIAAETGTVGLLVYLALYLIPLSMKSIKGLSFLVLYTVSSMFAHGLLNLPTLAFIMPMGIVALSRLDSSNSRKRRASRSHRRRRRSQYGSNN